MPNPPARRNKSRFPRAFALPLFILCLGLQAHGAIDSTIPAGNSFALFNGKDLSGWMAVPDSAKEGTWSAHDGVIAGTGMPKGYLRTLQTFENYRLRVEWRWTNKPGNSGVFLHGSGEDKVWPHCFEAQLQSGNAGELRANGGSQFRTDSPPGARSMPKKAASSERPAGEWNVYEIVCRDADVSLSVNGVLQNELKGGTLKSGWIGLQAEGGDIEFRNLIIEPLKPKS